MGCAKGEGAALGKEEKPCDSGRYRRADRRACGGGAADAEERLRLRRKRDPHHRGRQGVAAGAAFSAADRGGGAGGRQPQRDRRDLRGRVHGLLQLRQSAMRSHG